MLCFDGRMVLALSLVLVLSLVDGVHSNCCPRPTIPQPCPAGQKSVNIPVSVVGCNIPCANWFCIGVKLPTTTIPTTPSTTEQRIEPTTATTAIANTTQKLTTTNATATTTVAETKTATPITTSTKTSTIKTTNTTENTQPNSTTTSSIVTLPKTNNSTTTITTQESLTTKETSNTTISKQYSTTEAITPTINECDRVCWVNHPVTKCLQQFDRKIVTLMVKVQHCECEIKKCVPSGSCVYNKSLILNHEQFQTDCKQVCVCLKGSLRCFAACANQEEVSDCSGGGRPRIRPGGRRREHPEKVLARRRLMNQEVSKKCGCEIRKSVRCKRPTKTDNNTSMYLYIGISIAALLICIFIVLCVIKCCCTKGRLKDGKESIKCQHQRQRLSIKVRRTSSWMKTRSLPAAPCEEDGCPNSRCPASDNRKLLRSSNNKTAKNRYLPSPNVVRKSTESVASTNKAFSFQPTTDEEGTYYSQPNVNSIPNGTSSILASSFPVGSPLSTPIPLGSPLSASMLSISVQSHRNSITGIEMLTLNHAEIVDDFDPENDPDAENFRGKDRSYSQLSQLQSEVSHYQGLDTQTQNSTDKPIKSVDDDTTSVLYQSLDSPPYQSIEKYQQAINSGDSNEYLQASDGGSYQDMTVGVDGGNNYQDMSEYCKPANMSYPYSKKYLNEDLSIPKGPPPFNKENSFKYDLPKNTSRESPKNQDSLDSTHYEVSDKYQDSGCQNDDDHDDVSTSYLDLTAPDNELC